MQGSFIQPRLTALPASRLANTAPGSKHPGTRWASHKALDHNVLDNKDLLSYHVDAFRVDLFFSQGVPYSTLSAMMLKTFLARS